MALDSSGFKVIGNRSVFDKKKGLPRQYHSNSETTSLRPVKLHQNLARLAYVLLLLDHTPGVSPYDISRMNKKWTFHHRKFLEFFYLTFCVFKLKCVLLLILCDIFC